MRIAETERNKRSAPHLSKKSVYSQGAERGDHAVRRPRT
jgi:hypothetical protein